MFWLVGRKLNHSNREIFLCMGMISSVVVTLTLLVPVPQLFILFNLIISVSLPMIWVPAKSTHYSQMIILANKQAHMNTSRLGKMMQLLVFREFSISLGRISFFLLMVIGFDFGLGSSYYAMIILACFMPFGIWVLMKEK